MLTARFKVKRAVWEFGMFEALIERARADIDNIVDLTRDLIAIPSENPPGAAYRQCVERLTAELTELGLDHTVIPVPPELPGDAAAGAACIVGRYGDGSPTLYFHGHYDVVPAADPGQFSPRLVDGQLIGRGSADMKGGLAALICAIKAVKTVGPRLNGQIRLMIVPDEETGGRRGSKFLTDAGLIDRDAIGMVTPEPTSDVIWHANRGAITLRVTTLGRAAHVGQQHRGVNAFEAMVDVVNDLRQFKREVEQRQTRYRLDSADDPVAASHSILMLGGEARGGVNFNVVPDRCSFTIERRINPEEDFDIEKARLLDRLEHSRARGIALEVEILQAGYSASSPTDSVVAHALADTIASIRGVRPRFELCPGILETRWYARLGVPAFAYGAGRLEVAHGPAEYVNVAELADTAAIYAVMAVTLLGGQSN